MAPIVHGLESEFYPDVNFVYIDIDDPAANSFKSELAFRYQPHFVLLDGEGRVLQQWLGPVGEDQFREAFQKALE
jgi:hypothetical protein